VERHRRRGGTLKHAVCLAHLGHHGGAAVVDAPQTYPSLLVGGPVPEKLRHPTDESPPAPA
jgi:hypothetical protein